jgi:hypothetical protein
LTLERVRARTMAMLQNDELNATALEMYRIQDAKI